MTDTIASLARAAARSMMPASAAARTGRADQNGHVTTGGSIRTGARELLEALPNRVSTRYRVRIETAELTFLGAPAQPDFARLVIDYIPGDRLIELKSLKQYIGEFRNRHLSYERIANVIRDDIDAVFAPRSLQVTLSFQPRGGASTTVTIPADAEEDAYEAWAQSHGAPR